MFVPVATLPFWLIGLVSVALLGGGVYILWEWFTEDLVGTAWLLTGVALFGLSVVGRPLALLLLARPAQNEPRPAREGTVERIQRPDGTELHVEVYGPDGARPIVLTHGWGADSTEWYYFKRHLAEHFRLIVWDLRGLGKSSEPPNRDFQIETMAHDLDAVLALAGGQPAILAGHSIGGMIQQSYARLFPEALGSRVAGLVFIQTTYTNPLRTAVLGGLLTALQRPVIQPLLHLTIWLSPLVRVMIWLSYYNGTMHFFNALTGFAGTQSRGQLELVSRYPLFASPAALARGGLATLAFHEAQTLPRISVPSLIISGAQDKVTTPVASAFMQQAIPTAEHVQVAPAGHMGPFERHEQEIAAIRRFAEATFA